MGVERIAVRVVGYAAYATGVVGAAGTLGWSSTAAWLLLAGAGALPGGYLLAKDVAHRSLERDRARYAGEAYTPPPAQRQPGPAPEPLNLPPHP
jgi:hypothetical protein